LLLCFTASPNCYPHPVAQAAQASKLQQNPPGWVDTPIWTHVAGDAKASTLGAMAKRLPVRRIGQPDDIADAIRFLMRNGFVTGTVLHVEGGHRLI
jgi:hypothetical protein